MNLFGEVLDAETGKLLPARLYIQRRDGRWFFAESAASEGSAVHYKKQFEAGKDPVPSTGIEMHTTLSAHPFRVELTPGTYTITAEKGKEYHPWIKSIAIGTDKKKLTIKLKRWIDLSALDWYSGEIHSHRRVEDLPNLMLAEDLNVTFPFTYWAHDILIPPCKSARRYIGMGNEIDQDVISVDPTHVMYLMNTEFEPVLRTGKFQNACLGSMFFINHRSPFNQGVPPWRATAERAHKEGALIGFCKPCSAASLMSLPIMKLDLYQVLDNMLWRSSGASFRWVNKASENDFLNFEQDAKGFTQWGYIDYGLRTYYALLNCGFRLQPMAGVASGVMPNPLGFNRVYVHLPKGFSYQAWIQGLKEGRSFVTNGPMVFIRVDGCMPGHTLVQAGKAPRVYRLEGYAVNNAPLDRIEIIVNGQIVSRLKPENRKTENAAFRSRIRKAIPIDRSSWIAVRCVEKRKDTSNRLAHTSPVHVDVKGRPLRPPRLEVKWLVQHLERDLTWLRDALPKKAWKEKCETECRDALRFYQNIYKRSLGSGGGLEHENLP